jgi:hypothetical protein
MARRRHSRRRATRLTDSSAAYAALSNEARIIVDEISRLARGGKGPILLEVEPGRFVEVKLSDKWRKFDVPSPENIGHARSIVDLAEAAFEAERATKQ